MNWVVAVKALEGDAYDELLEADGLSLEVAGGFFDSSSGSGFRELRIGKSSVGVTSDVSTVVSTVDFLGAEVLFDDTATSLVGSITAPGTAVKVITTCGPVDETLVGMLVLVDAH